MYNSSFKTKFRCIFLPILKVCQKCEFKVFILLSIILLFLFYNSLIQYLQHPPRDDVDGWERNVSRIARNYILPDKLTTLTFVKHSCNSHAPLLLIIVCSEINRDSNRRAIRRTWASKVQKMNVTVLFLLGRGRDNESEHKIMQESLQYEDVIVENFIDTYNNLTLKSIMMLKWVKQNCRDSRFIMKIDDDVYLNVNNLMNMIKSVPNEALPSYLQGKLYTKEKPHRSPFSKWFMPKYMFLDEAYPHYLCGAGYIMSTQVAGTLYEESLINELVYLEDLFITGICAKKANVKPFDHLGFHFFEHAVTVECNSIHPHMILLSHHLDEYSMEKIHDQVLEC